MASSDLVALEDDRWLVAPFQGPLDVLWFHVNFIETGWAEQENIQAPIGHPSEAYRDSLVEAVGVMEAAMAATWSPEAWLAYAQGRCQDPLPEALDAAVARAEFDLVYAWNAQVTHVYALTHDVDADRLLRESRAQAAHFRLAVVPYTLAVSS